MLPSMNTQPIPFKADPAALAASHMRSLVRASIAASARIFERDGNGHMPDPEVILQRRNWGDDRSARMLIRATSGPAMTSQTNWAQELAQVSLALLAHLVPMSAAAALLAQGLNLQFGNAGTIKVAGIASGQAKWVQEGAPVAVVQFLLTGPTLAPKKLASICALTQEMLQNENAEEFVRAALVESTGPALDAALFSSTAASSSHPAGALLGATSVTPSALTDALDAMGSDVSNLVAALGPYAGNGNLTLVANPAQATRYLMYTEAPFRMLMSNALSAGTVIAVANNALASVIEPVVIDASTATALHEEDASPQPIGSASPAKSMFQTQCAALRVRLPATWTVRNASAVASIVTTKW
jgi:hypothetical protein